MLTLIEVINGGESSYTFRDLKIEPSDIKQITESLQHNQVLREDKSKFPDNLSEHTRFSRIVTSDGAAHVVVGSINEIERKKAGARRVLLG